jgi:hypothetical protein
MLALFEIGMPPVWQSVVTQMQMEASNTIREYPFNLNSRNFCYLAGNSLSMAEHSPSSNRIAELGWTNVEALETHLRLRVFEDDWNYEGMEAYDDL